MTGVRRSWPVALATAAGMVALAVVFASRFRPAHLLLVETARPALAAIILLLATIGAGRLGSFRRISDQLAAGFPIFGTAVAICALADVRIVVPLTVVAACYGAFVLARSDWKPVTPPSALVAIPIALALACAIAPVNSPDELVYKLSIPRAWLMHGRMFEMPLSSHSYLVMALQAADVAALALGGGIAAKLAHLGLFLAALAILRRLAGNTAVIVVAWTPALMIIAGWAWSEWGVLAALLLSYERWEHEDVRGASIALGCAVASKYTALPWLLAFGVLLLIRRRDVLLRSALLVAAFGGFFYVRNLVWTGSPFAPLFLPNAPAVANYRGSGWMGLIQGVDIFDARIADESLGILLPLFAIAGLFAWKKRRDLVLLGAIQMPILLTIAPGSRNIVNGVVPLAIAGVALLETRALSSWLVRAAGAVALAMQLVLTIFVLDSYEFVPFLAGRENAAQYIARTRAFAAPYDWIARNTSQDAHVLLLAENRTFYLDREWTAGGNLDGPRVAAWLDGFDGPDRFRDALRARGIGWIVIHTKWYRVGPVPQGTIEKEFLLDVSPRTNAMLMQYLATRASRVYRDGEYMIYRCL